MYHYTYKITVLNPTDSRRYYIGVRSCKCDPALDKYLGSSKHLKKWIENNPDAEVKKEVLYVWETRKQAVQHEVDLHIEHDVARNEEFFNVARQTSCGFDTSGSHVHSEERRKKISEMFRSMPKTEAHRKAISEALKGRGKSESHRAKLSASKKGRASPLRGISIGKGIPKSDEHRKKISEALTGIKRGDETLRRMSAARKGVPQTYSPLRYEDVECPHCHKIGMKANMTRYHFSNCKSVVRSLS